MEARSRHAGRWARPAAWAPAAALALLPAAALAAPRTTSVLGPSPMLSVFLLAGLGLLGLAFLMVSSFVKIAVVLSILRSALGTGQVPPATIVTGLALVLSIFVMAPVATASAARVVPALERYQRNEAAPKELAAAAQEAAAPWREFLWRHAHPDKRTLFRNMARRNTGDATVSERSFLVLVPAFVVSELTEAFQIGFLLFLPFLVIDLVVSNILMALGMHMLSPATVSLPFKLLLFVMADGWRLVTQGLVGSYLQ